MAKRLICFPFVDGNLREYSFNNLTDKEREQVYNEGKLVKEFSYNKDKVEIWKPNEEVELTLNYIGYSRGRSAVTFYWQDENGHTYPMFIKDVDEMLRQNMGVNEIHGIFTYVKRGANYGIKFLREIKTGKNEDETELKCDNCRQRNLCLTRLINYPALSDTCEFYEKLRKS